MIERAITSVLRQRLSEYPAVTLVGPRQAGKTTLARSLGGVYFDLEQEPDRVSLDLRWDELVAGKKLVILDEAQTWPALFPRLRGAIDEARSRKGRFLLLGSVSPALMTQVSESLAGRLAIIELTPLLMGELPGVPLRRLWCRGGFPDGGILRAGSFPTWQRNYLQLLVQRDLPAWGLPARPQVTQRLTQMLAALHGQLWNASQVGQSLGLSYHTVNTYLDYLAGSYLIRRLPPFMGNIGKRLVRMPRIYWRDSGLLHATLNVADSNDLLRQPWAGASWEGFVIEQILGAISQADRHADAFFFRTSDQHEIDLVLDFGRSQWAIEIKLTTAPSASSMGQLNETADLIKADRRYLISQTRRSTVNAKQGSCDLATFLDIVRG